MSGLRRSLYVSLYVVSAAVCFAVVSGVVAAATQNRPLWLSGSAQPQVEKLSELPANTLPETYGFDCVGRDTRNGSTWCAYKTPLGTMANARLLDGPNGDYQMETFYGFIAPSNPGQPQTVITYAYPRSWDDGAAILYRSTYDPAKLKYVESYGLPTIKRYEYRDATAQRFADASGTAYPLYPDSIAYSQNGKWMVAGLSGGGIVRFDTQTYTGKAIAIDQNQSVINGGYHGSPNLAVSDDGRFVASNRTLGYPPNTTPTLRVYDAESCRDQFTNRLKATAGHDCEYKDIWSGQYRTGNTQGLKQLLPGVEAPQRLRFLSPTALTFDGIYDRTSPTQYRVARYRVTMTHTTTRDYVGVLGMGDSYISGEGAKGKYFAGTDTQNNKCHLAWTSYPYAIGAKTFPYGRSVACSGAKMLDVSMAAGDPEPDPKKKISSEGDYLGKNKISWKKRLDDQREKILSTFTPGYAQQTIFAREYKPRTVLLSIGGNDVGFAQIIVSCVTPLNTSSCYRFYEDRVPLAKHILSQYDRLVATYKQVQADSGGKLYVVGYPNIAKDGGNCAANVLFNAEEVVFSSQLTTYLNSVIKRAAAEAGAYYVDTAAAFSGHRLCETTKDQIAMNGLTKGDDKGYAGMVNIAGALVYVDLRLANESYHPNTLGHKLLTQTILTKTNNLTAPMPNPVKNSKPPFDTNDPFLRVPRGVNLTTRTEPTVWQQSQTTPIYLRNQPYKLNSQLSLAQGAQTEVVLHSDPVTLYKGTDAAQATFTIPATTPPGFHTLDVYGVTATGEPVDYRQLVYVIADIHDYDGDGLKNEDDSCVAVPQSGLDDDQNGVDDACDSDTPDQAPTVLDYDLPPDEPTTITDDDPLSQPNDPYTDSLAVPFTPPQPKPTEEKEPPQPKPTPTADPKPTPTPATQPTPILPAKNSPLLALSPAISPITATLTTNTRRPSTTLAPNYGTILTPPTDLPQPNLTPTTPPTEVLGTHAQRPKTLPKTAATTTTPQNHASRTIVIASLFAMSLLAALLWCTRSHKH